MRLTRVRVFAAPGKFYSNPTICLPPRQHAYRAAIGPPYSNHRALEAYTNPNAALLPSGPLSDPTTRLVRPTRSEYAYFISRRETQRQAGVTRHDVA